MKAMFHTVSFCLAAWLAASPATAGTLTTPAESLPVHPSRPPGLPAALLGQAIPPATNNEPVRFTLPDGVFRLESTLVFRPQAGVAIIIEAAPGAHPVLSGGAVIAGWHPASATLPGLPAAAHGKIWEAPVPSANGRPISFRQLWINDRKAVRARTPNGEVMIPLVAWDRTREVATIPAAWLPPVREVSGVEMTLAQQWEIAILRLKTMTIHGPNAEVTFQAPESGLEFAHPWPQPVLKTNYASPFFLTGAIEFLDAPGEWFEDLAAGKVYYWPRDGEDMARDRAIIPVLETLVQIEGTPEDPVTNLHFKGITFAHTAWQRPAEQGHVPLQAGMFLLDAKKLSPKGTPYHPGLDNLAWIGRPPAAVSVKNARHVTFENCTFEHLASAGLDFAGGTHADRIEGCTFRDIGGNGIQLGTFSARNTETHEPYNPSDTRELCTDETIANNLVTDCGNEDWSCVGIGVGYARNVQIVHNEVFNLPYTGISLGWGWTKATNAMRDNLIHANHVHHVATRLCDTAGIYTLSAQPGTVVSENSVHDLRMSPYAFDPEHWFYLYLDEGSSFITVRDNWCPAERFLKNANGPGNVWTNNGPQVSATIKNAAGLEPAYQYLLNSDPAKLP